MRRRSPRLTEGIQALRASGHESRHPVLVDDENDGEDAIERRIQITFMNELEPARAAWYSTPFPLTTTVVVFLQEFMQTRPTSFEPPVRFTLRFVDREVHGDNAESEWSAVDAFLAQHVADGDASIRLTLFGNWRYADEQADWGGE
jgi:hypothetical protein